MVALIETSRLPSFSGWSAAKMGYGIGTAGGLECNELWQKHRN
jgi:hypothetical protein